MPFFPLLMGHGTGSRFVGAGEHPFPISSHPSRVASPAAIRAEGRFPARRRSPFPELGAPPETSPGDPPLPTSCVRRPPRPTQGSIPPKPVPTPCAGAASSGSGVPSGRESVPSTVSHPFSYRLPLPHVILGFGHVRIWKNFGGAFCIDLGMYPYF
ncbi:hypothetical protein GUJ93_ZPchr0006g42942 [Zizania palustris]|uniref:Uncharacterized protein n=1 Tax=Zizania palustris TaxID=103762 RepID=A0A8J5SI92_ZIZPA|nr:hypothetical protein GUJ93_ZPchr0006g42942 [Zizania palustris]